MDELRVEQDQPNLLQGALVIRVFINGEIVPEPQYCLEVESFI